MFAIQCPACQHQNTPGARYCADCGVPLNLKPCPACGKVDEVTAKVCLGCGATFPPIALADGPRQESATAGASVSLAPGSSRAWPLILVAIAAGGIPLAWMNRAHLPLPKAWQIQGPNAAGSAAMPAPPTVPPAALAPPPVPAALPVPSAEPSVAPPKAAVAEAEPASKAVATAQTKHSKAHSSRSTPAKVVAKDVPVAKEVPAPRACTEAVAALGLCDPKQDKQ